jgi:glycosyltransferase involved in cell wall biosynthesis
MKDILIITSYFPPEIGAASNRIFHLAEGLHKSKFNVTVITPLPNYPTGNIFEPYRGKRKHISIENNIKIYRLWIYATVSKNKVVRLFAMLSYSFSLVWFFIFNKIPKTVIIQSPPLLVAFTSILFLKSKKRKLILNVSDLWPLAGLKLGALKKNFGYRILEKIEFYNYKYSDLILGQSDEILTHIRSIIQYKETFLYRNYPNIDTKELQPSENSSGKIKMVYAGLLGVAQGIYKLCQKLDYTNIEFHIYGAGPEQKQIEDFVNENENLPIFYHGDLSRKELHRTLLNYDLTIIPLLIRIYGSVPSKIFEYAKLGLPMLYFGGGEGETIVRENNLGWVAEAGNYDNLNLTLSQLTTKDLNSKFKYSIKNTAENQYDFNKQLSVLCEKL